MSRRGKLVSPILFSQHFNDCGAALEREGLFDPVLNSDSKLFIDPLLLESSDHPLMESAYHSMRAHLSTIVRLIIVSRNINDAAWKKANRLLSLRERPETCLGFGSNNISGTSRSDEIRSRILRTIKEITELGESDPEIVSILGTFEEGVGPDTISDLTTAAIMPELEQLTNNFCDKYNIPMEGFGHPYDCHLPQNPFREDLPVLLVPRDVLRDLPLAADWADVSRVAFENERIRDAFNNFVGRISHATLLEKKNAIKKVAMQSLENFRSVFESILGSSDAYDPDADPLNLYRFREIIAGETDAFVRDDFRVRTSSPAELRLVVLRIIDEFKKLIENNNLWELLWVGDKPKREKASQLLFFAVAEMFCKANNVDIAPETSPGGGPVDFRFSVGYQNRLLVEIKLSKGKVVQGYKTQIGVYQAASDACGAIFLLIDVGWMKTKHTEIEYFKKEQEKDGKKMPEIIVVDGRRRRSASVRSSPFEVIRDDVDDIEDEDDS